MEDFIVAEYFEEFPNFLMAFRLTRGYKCICVPGSNHFTLL